MLGAENPIALDYIIKHPKDKRKPRDYEAETRRNALTVILKNAVMQQWTKVKDTRKKPTIKEILQLAVKKKREDALRKAQGKS